MGSPRARLYLYLAAVIVAGWLILICSTWGIPPGWRVPREILFWGGLVVAIELFPIGLVQRRTYVTLGFPVVYGALLGSGPVVAGWAAVCGALLGIGLSKKLSLDAVFFNGGQLILSVSAAWMVYRWMGGVLLTAGSLAPFLAVVTSALAYFLVNTFSVSTATALREKTSPLDVWLVDFKWSVPNYLGQTPVGFFVALTYAWIGWWAVLFVMFLLLVVDYTYKLYLDVKREHVDVKGESTMEVNPVFRGRGFITYKDLCFVLIPLKGCFLPIYEDHIRKTVEQCGMRCVKADDIFSNAPIIEDVWEYINKARLIIADLTGKNPNVFYETGISHTLGKSTILITQSIDDIPFDLRHLRNIVYENTYRGGLELRRRLKRTIENVVSER